MTYRLAYLRRARHWIANRGWRGFLAELWYRFCLIAKGKPIPGREIGSSVPYPFDVQYGVDTGGLVWGESLDGPSSTEPSSTEPSSDNPSSNKPRSNESAYWATGYYGISPSAFTAALARLELDWSRFTFVDVGCGKGRALLLALRFPFRRALGIELSPALAAVAQANLQRFAAPWRQANLPAEALVADATTSPIPDGPVVMFLYHPFAAPVMRRFLAHVLKAARGERREMYLLYANPELGQMVGDTPGVEWLWKDTFALTPEEGAADRFGSYGEQFSAYRVWQAT